MENNSQLTSAAVSDRGLSEKRPQNEDSFLELPQIGLFAVADGVGGAQAGEVASQMAMEVLAEAFVNAGSSADPVNVMRSAIQAANSAVFQMARDIPQLSSMATTVVALHVARNKATIAHVGDSRLYSFSPNGDIRRETDDHSMVADEVRAGRMTEEQADNHPSKNIINRALGADSAVEIDLRSVTVEPGTTFILCSDGITRHINDGELSTVFRQQKDLDTACSQLKELCFARGAEDNLTAVVVKVGEAETRTPENRKVPSAHEVLDIEEPTVTNARSPFESLANDDEPLLELEHFRTPPGDSLSEIELEPEEKFSGDEEQRSSQEPKETAPAIEEQAREIPVEHEKATPSDITIETVRPVNDKASADFSMFGESGADDKDHRSSSGLAKAVSAIALLLAGGIGGMSGYHYWIAGTGAPAAPMISEMRSANIPQSAFEENRRNVDRDPAGYASRFGQDPQDSEDYYLLGRAYLLSGDYQRARMSLIEARNRLSGADPANAQILTSDIAMGLALTSDTTIQALFKREISGPITQIGMPSPTGSPTTGIAMPSPTGTPFTTITP